MSGSRAPPGSHQDLACKLTKLEDFFYQFYGSPNSDIPYELINGRRSSHLQREEEGGLQGEPHNHALETD